MRVAILISGFLRTIDYNFKKIKNILNNYECDFYLHISNNEELDKYNNNILELDYILNLIQPIKCIIENEMMFPECKHLNLKRMWYKIYILGKLVTLQENNLDFKYDLVIRIRPDLYIENEQINLDEYIFNENNIYGSLHNNLFLDEFNFGSSIAMEKYCKLFLNFDEYNKNKINRAEDFIKLHCENIKLNMKPSNINHKLVLSLCNIIAITGDSGTGKSTLMKHLKCLFDKDVLEIEGDRYHKWERGDKNWNNYTHLNPNANYISKLSNDMYDLKIGKDIYQVDYDHSTGKFTDIEKLENKNNIILCGLHSLFDKKSNNLLNFKIYLDTDEKLRRYWKIKRDVKSRGYTIERVLEQIDKRMKDYQKYIKPQSDNSDFIINFYTDEEFDYTNIDEDPNIYLNLTIKNNSKNIIDYLNILTSNKIIFKYSNTNNGECILNFDYVTEKFSNVLNTIILNYNVKFNFNNYDVTYYTIILSLIIYLVQ